MKQAVHSENASASSTAGYAYCAARNKTGRPCQAPALADSKWCYFHDPRWKDRRREARSAGGKARHGRSVTDNAMRALLAVSDELAVKGELPIITLRNPNDLMALVERAANDLLKLENSVSRAKALGGLAAIAGQLWQLAILEREVETLKEIVIRAENEGL